MEVNFVYWIKDETCKEISSDGYVGVSKYPNARYKAHLRNKRVPSNSGIDIIFEGTREECFDLEYSLRPDKGIGWNKATGGQQGFKIGFFHSNNTKERLKSKWTKERKVKASILKAQLNKNLIGQKRPKQSLAMTGKSNPMYGTKRPKYVIDAMVNVNLGKPAKNRQELYCMRCHRRTSYSRLLRYHNKCSIT